MKVQSIVVLMVLVTSLNSFAGKEGGGGNSGSLNTALNAKLGSCAVHALEWGLRNNKDRLLGVVSRLWDDQLKDASAKKVYSDMQARGLIEDAGQTKMMFKTSCKDERGIERSATAGYKMGATICINPQAIVDDLGVHVSDAILLGLLGHELSHHFGYADKVVNQKGQEIYPLGSALVDVFEEQDNRSDVNDRVTDLSFCQSPAYANAMQSVKYNVEF